jgi:hypothetical protein
MVAKAEKTIDIDESPEVLRLAGEVQSSGQPAVLQRQGKPVARLVPVGALKRKRRSAKTGKGPFDSLIGLGSSGGSDVATYKHQYIADAIASHKTL